MSAIATECIMARMAGKKIIIFGASSIAGQYMQVYAPGDWHVINFRKLQLNDGYHTCDLTNLSQIQGIISFYRPDAVINFSSATCPAQVQETPSAYAIRNIDVPVMIADCCDLFGARYIHISDKVVFGESGSTYKPESKTCPIDEVGKQLVLAEEGIQTTKNWTIVRLPYSLGLNKAEETFPNFLEYLFETKDLELYFDAKSSITFADDAARALWSIAIQDTKNDILHIGLPIGISSYEVGSIVASIKHDGTTVKPVKRDRLGGKDVLIADAIIWDKESAIFPVVSSCDFLLYIENKIRELWFEWRKTNDR